MLLRKKKLGFSKKKEGRVDFGSMSSSVGGSLFVHVSWEISEEDRAEGQKVNCASKDF